MTGFYTGPCVLRLQMYVVHALCADLQFTDKETLRLAGFTTRKEMKVSTYARCKVSTCPRRRLLTMRPCMT